MVSNDELERITRRSCASRKYMTGAYIHSADNRSYAVGWSHVGTWHMDGLYSMHAEMHAVFRSRFKLEGATCRVMTITRKSGAVANAMPCVNCAIALYKLGISVCYYTTGLSPTGAILWDAITLDGNFADSLKIYAKQNA